MPMSRNPPRSKTRIHSASRAPGQMFPGEFSAPVTGRLRVCTRISTAKIERGDIPRFWFISLSDDYFITAIQAGVESGFRHGILARGFRHDGRRRDTEIEN